MFFSPASTSIIMVILKGSRKTGNAIPERKQTHRPQTHIDTCTQTYTSLANVCYLRRHTSTSVEAAEGRTAHNNGWIMAAHNNAITTSLSSPFKVPPTSCDLQNMNKCNHIHTHTHTYTQTHTQMHKHNTHAQTCALVHTHRAETLLRSLSVKQCIQKVFRPLYFFHILLGYSLILNGITSFFSLSSIYTLYPIMTRQKLFFLHKKFFTQYFVEGPLAATTD
jgi:hypothetical protein